VNRHQVDGVERFEHGVRFVAGSQRVDVIRDPGERGISAVLDAPHEAAHLLDVFPRLEPPAAPKLEGIRRLREDLLDQIGRRHAIDERDPTGHARSHVAEDGAVLVIEPRHLRRRLSA
jgi:hypothetical protein